MPADINEENNSCHDGSGIENFSCFLRISRFKKIVLTAISSDIRQYQKKKIARHHPSLLYAGFLGLALFIEREILA
jgi:hypothetical protein